MMKKIIKTKKAPYPIGPYNQAVASHQLVFLSGQIAIDPDTDKLVTDSIENETHRVMKNLQAVLEEAGSSFDNVLRCTIFIRDMAQFARINEAYGMYFGENPPARETVEVSGLPKNVNIEISCIALVN